MRGTIGGCGGARLVGLLAGWGGVVSGVGRVAVRETIHVITAKWPSRSRQRRQLLFPDGD